MKDDGESLQARVAALSARSAIRSAQSSSRLRADAESSGFIDFYRAFQEQFGPGTRITYFDCPAGTYGRPHAPGVAFSDPAPVALKRRGK